MKPIQLTMKAFGPFKDEQTVDFTSLQGERFLITGDTGAGKTTIYDAIMFALFEETSNSADSSKAAKGTFRSKTMLQSKFADKGDPTIVTLQFEESGKVYTVERKIRNQKKQGGAGYGEAKFDASLSDGDKLAVSGSSKVTAEVVRILGLDADQFRKIAMLAQGQFKAFMEAKDSARKEVLGKIFQSKPYTELMAALKEATARLSKQAEGYTQKRSILMSPENFPLPADLTEEQRALYNPNHPSLAENIRELIANEDAALIVADKEEAEAGERLYTLTEQKAKAENNNAALDELEALIGRLAALEEQKPEMERRRERYAVAEKAVRNVLHYSGDVEKAAKATENAERHAREAQTALEQAKDALIAAEKDAEQTADLEQQAQVAKSGADTIAAQLPSYRTLADKKKRREDCAKAVNDNTVAIEQQEKLQQHAEKALTAVNAELETLGETAAKLVQAKNNAQLAKESFTKLTGANGPEAQIRKLKATKKALADKVERLKQAEEAATAAEWTYKQLQLSFLRNQAAVLAKELGEKIAAEGQAPCPVCGRIACGEDMGRFAAIDTDFISEDRVNEAQETAKLASDNRNTASADVTSASSNYDHALENALTLAGEFFPARAPWDEAKLLDDALIARLIGEKEAEKAQKAADYAAAEKADNRRKELEAEKAKWEKQQTDAESALIRLKSNVENGKQNIVALESEIEGLVRHLPFADEAEAKTEQARLEADHADKTSKVAALNAAVNETRSALAAAETADRERTEKLAEAKKALEADVAAFREALEENGFADEAAWKAALPETADYEKWLKAEQKVLTDFDNDVKNTAERLAKQQEKTAGLARTDLTELTEKIEAQESAKKSLEKRNQTMHFEYDRHKDTLDKLEKNAAEGARIAAAAGRLLDLSEVANGFNGEDGKHAFDGYVLSRSFDQILARATMHLDDMTGGRYRLIHETSGYAKASDADFVIEIFDNYNGEQREIGSISGGESFQVAMALALGLSDVAQAKAFGGKTIDAMFIDEGFGTLDGDALHNMLNALKNIAGGNRMVGMISHRDDLEEFISKKIRVERKSENKASFIRQEQ